MHSLRIYEATPEIAVKGNLGIVYLEELCKEGTADKIAAFYRHDYQSISTCSHVFVFCAHGDSSSRKYFEALAWVEEDSGVKLARVSVGPRQWLVYRETDNADEVRPNS